jgi:hypothetical protein
VNTPTRGRDWVIEAQKLLLSLRDIAGASISLSEDGEITEVNILAEGRRPPKQIVRDVRSALRAEYQVDLDYRRISVAQKRGGTEAWEDGAEAPAAGPTILALPEARVVEEPAVERLRFVGLSVSLDQNTARARVELALGGREAAGEATGPSTRREVARLIGQATVDAIGRFLAEPVALTLVDADTVRAGEEEVTVAVVRFRKNRNDIVLAGCCPSRHDLQQSVVYATLAAVNRLLGRLAYREPVEYEIRPTSMF